MSDSTPSPEEIERRKRWFEQYCKTLDQSSVVLPPSEGVKHRCPCCGCRTLGERGGFDICPVCFWEDDGQDDADADAVRGGPNGALSLTQARCNFKEFGACDRKSIEHVRKPTPDEQ